MSKNEYLLCLVPAWEGGTVDLDNVRELKRVELLIDRYSAGKALRCIDAYFIPNNLTA
jgi:hypothetical protein